MVVNNFYYFLNKKSIFGLEPGPLRKVCRPWQRYSVGVQREHTTHIQLV